MKNTTALLFIGLIVVIGAVFVLRTPQPSTDGLVAPLTGDVQKVTLSEKNSNYFPQKITVKAGLPVELTLDSSVSGCFRSFTVRDLGIAKYARTPAEKITFVPAQKGTFPFSCSMGMGTGTLEVI